MNPNEEPYRMDDNGKWAGAEARLIGVRESAVIKIVLLNAAAGIANQAILKMMEK